MDREGGGVTDRGLQYHLRTIARFDITNGGGTFLTIRAETGKGFDNSWNNTGAGLGSGQWIFNVKTLTLHQQIGSQLEVQVGGIEFDPGAGTDSVYAAGDGAMTGYRLLLKKRSAWQPDKFSLTGGYVGDFATPNMFARFRMGQVNYVQLLAQQEINKNVAGSAEFDSIRDVAFSRLAIHCRKLWIF